MSDISKHIETWREAWGKETDGSDVTTYVAEQAYLHGLRVAAMAVHALRPAEHELGGSGFEQRIAYKHVLGQWAKDRDAVGDLIPDKVSR